MTPEDPTETLLTESLDRHAADAPADHDLLTTVHNRLRRRRTSRTISTAALAAVAITATITATQSLNHNADPATVTTKGFRWESYKTVQVQVPENWTNFTSSPAPCGSSTAPTIGRLSPWLTLKEAGCAVAVLPLKERHEYVWFDDVQEPGVKEYDAGWTEETREVGGIHVSVLTKDNALRKRILDSAVPLTNGPDAYGCEQNGYLPSDDENTAELPEGLGKVTSVDICEYWAARQTQQSSLIGGSSLDGKQATRLAQQLIADFKTGRQVIQGTVYCMPQGRKTIRLTLHTADGDWPVHIQELDCIKQYALEVGSGLRGLSVAFTDLLLTGVHRPSQLSDTILVPGGFTPPAR